jgi:hypothetical protein
MIKNNATCLLVWLLLTLGGSGYAQKKAAKKVQPVSDRQVWLTEMDKMVRPVLYNLAQDSLRIVMPR